MRLLRRLCWLVPALTFALALTLLGSAQAQGLQDCVAVDGRRLDAAALTPHLRVLEDRSAQQSWAQVQGQPEAAWRPATPATLTPGYSASAFWLRWCVQGTAAPQTLWLQLRPARLEQVQLFARQRRADGRWVDLPPQRAGTDQAFDQRTLPLRDSAFALTLGAQPQELWLRVASRSALAMELSLHPPAELLREEQARLWADGLIAGLSLLLMLVSAMLALAWRERTYGYIALYLMAVFFYESGMRGSAFMLFWPQATDWAVRALASFGVLAHLSEVAALMRLLDTARRQPRWHRLMLGVAALDALALLVCVFGDYRLGTQLAGLCNLSQGLLMMGACLRAVAQGLPLAHAWTLALACQFLGMMPRILSLLGWQAHSVLADYGPPLVGLLGVLIVLLAMVARMRQQRLQHEQALETAVQQRTAELAAASALAQASDAAKGRLLGYLGHDLRAPLASVVQLTRQLQPDRGFEADRRAIEHSSQLLLEMIDELQRFARAPEASAAPELLPAPVYIHGLLRELDQQAQALVRSGGNRLRLQIDASLPPVLAVDARRLRQALFNLLSNAAKFTREGCIDLRAAYREGQLLLSVIDQGPGIAEADQALVFEPFVRAQGSQGLPGLGLGLSIVRQTVQAMGGRIELHSRLGAGCRFELALPLAPAQESEVAWPPLRELGMLGLMGEEAGGPARWALVLDACVAAREALVERLGLAGYDCMQAADLMQAQLVLMGLPAGAVLELLLVEPLSLGSAGRSGLAAAQALAPQAQLLCCSARPEAGDALYKPAPEALWWAALRPACG